MDSTGDNETALENRSPVPVVRELILEALARGRSVRLGFQGESMSPLLRPGDSILVAPASSAPRPGDIVLFESNGAFVAHRVLRPFARGGFACLRVKGDFTAEGAQVLPLDRVLGVVRSRERRGAVRDLRTPAMRALGGAAVLLSPWAVRLGFSLPRFLRRWIRRLVFRAGELLL